MEIQPSSLLLPPKPEEPLDSECCGTGCTPCVFDIYKTKLKKWEDECQQISNGSTCANDSSEEWSIISPYEYSSYKVTEIIEDCLKCKILQFHKGHEGEKQNNSSWNTYQPFPVKIGQHVVLKIGDKCRQYTVLDLLRDGGFRILFKIYDGGELTPKVDQLVVGQRVDMRGPFGKEFEYKSGQYSNLIMFAAGTGIAPFARIIDQVLDNEKDNTRLLLYYACKNEEEVMISDKLKEWARSWNFLVEYFISNVKDEKKAKNVHYGMKTHFKKIDKSVIEALCKKYSDNNKVLYMICGTKSFEKDIFNYLKSCGVSKEEKIKTF